MDLAVALDLLKRVSRADETTIINWRQNHPELVVQDLRVLLDLSESQVEMVRKVLMLRGVNKWLWARRKFLDLKHEFKFLVGQCCEKEITYKELRKAVLNLYARMQHIAKMPRWVEWGTHLHKKMSENDKDVVVKGRKM